MEVITKQFLSWASILEESTRMQVQMTSEMPFIFPHVALMPDAYLGKQLEQRAENARFDPSTYAANWRLQLSTLGSGNHFIEVSLDEEDRVWLFLHSGSRGVGNKIAIHHIKVAQELCRKWWINLPDPDLAYLVEGTDEFWAYIRELRWAQHFALLGVSGAVGYLIVGACAGACTIPLVGTAICVACIGAYAIVGGASVTAVASCSK